MTSESWFSARGDQPPSWSAARWKTVGMRSPMTARVRVVAETRAAV